MKKKLSSFVFWFRRLLRTAFGFLEKILFAVIWTVLWFPVAVMQAFDRSYFPELPRKCFFRRLMENIFWVLLYHRANVFYCLYGLDTKSRTMAEYIDENRFWKGLDCCNSGGNSSSQICLLRNKFLFYKFLSANSIPTPEVFGVIRNGTFYDIFMNEVTVDCFADHKDFFLKSIDGECASFVKRIGSIDELAKYNTDFQHGSFILQKSIVQDENMYRLNPASINTIRVITVLDKRGNARVFSSVLRCGTSKTGPVDNWAVGGLIIGITNDGQLKQFGLYKPQYGRKTMVHPDSGVVFEGFTIPNIERAYELVCKAHRLMYGIGAVGWDVAITPDGPCIIEGNDNFEISILQACNGPLKAEWIRSVAEYIGV